MKGLGRIHGGLVWSRYSLGIDKIWSRYVGEAMVKMLARYGQDMAKI